MNSFFLSLIGFMLLFSLSGCNGKSGNAGNSVSEKNIARSDVSLDINKVGKLVLIPEMQTSSIIRDSKKFQHLVISTVNDRVDVSVNKGGNSTILSNLDEINYNTPQSSVIQVDFMKSYCYAVSDSNSKVPLIKKPTCRLFLNTNYSKGKINSLAFLREYQGAPKIFSMNSNSFKDDKLPLAIKNTTDKSLLYVKECSIRHFLGHINPYKITPSSRTIDKCPSGEDLVSLSITYPSGTYKLEGDELPRSNTYIVVTN